MKTDAWHLPWGRETVPHAVLDIIRGCNIACQACYNAAPDSIKPLNQIALELKTLLTRRRLDSVTLAGGEPLLHPSLCEIVRLVKSHGLGVELFSNAVLLDDRNLAALKEAGMDIIYAHIDSGQMRPDLPSNPTPRDLRNLWELKTQLIARHGIDVGLTMTAYEANLAETRNMVEYVLDSPHVNYLLITLFRDSHRIEKVWGDLDSGMRASAAQSNSPRCDNLTNPRVNAYLRESLRLRPFGYLGSNRDAGDPRWLSYLVAVRRCRDGAIARYSIKPSAFERLFLALSLRQSGKYPMYRQQSTPHLIVHLAMNALMGGDFRGNWKFLLQSLRRGNTFKAKRLLLQCPADIAKEGIIVHCVNCPDAVVKNGGLVPVCISDKIC